MTPLWTSREISVATDGEAKGDFACNGVAFDSREIELGDLFLALKGEESDGHLFVEKAFANGASGAVVSTEIAHPQILVEDTEKALNNLAHAARTRVDAKIIGVTGSAGKTGTKEALYAALDRCSRGFAHRSVKSYNNHVGVPLSLCRMPASSQYGIFEMGMNHKGELGELTKLVRPDVAIVTTIAPAHIGYFKDEHEIAEAKAEIFEGLAESGTAIIPFDSPHYGYLRSQAEKYAARIISFGLNKGADICAIDHVVAPCGGSLVTAAFTDRTLCYTLAQAGDHWVANSLAVMAAVEAVGANLGIAGLALAELEGMPGRGARHHIALPGGEALLIDESYNANPASMHATIRELGRLPAKRHVAILGSMKELGDKSDEYHTGLAQSLLDANVGLALLVGDEMQALYYVLAKHNKAMISQHFSNVGDALANTEKSLYPGDVILIKGSNSMGLSRIVHALTQRRD
jgi:UDP-N-acetylmuramoyl-tripeptide--D-alanyl-D-alanine ligase